MLLKFGRNKLLSRINCEKDVLTLIDKFGVYLGGGALRGCFTTSSEDIVDYDIFFQSLDGVNVAQDFLLNRGYEKIFECPLGLLSTYKKNSVKIQFIKEFTYASPQAAIETFDIDACCICMDKTHVYTTYSAIRAIRKKEITFNRIDYPVATFKRVLKYLKKGYSIPNKSVDIYVKMIYNKGLHGQELNTRIYVD